MIQTMMKAIVGIMIPTVFLCNASAEKKIKRKQTFHEEEITAIVQAHKASRRY